MLTTIEYLTFKGYINKYKNELSKEYIIDILLLLKPLEKIFINKEEIKNEEQNIGLIIIKIDKILSNFKELNNSFIKRETIKLFKLIWDSNNLKM